MKLANCIFLAAGLLLAQQAPPVVVKRAASGVANDGIPSPDKYPFDQLISILNTDAPPARPVKGPAPLPVAPGALADVPKDFKPARDVTAARDREGSSRGWAKLDDGEAHACAGQGRPSPLHVWRWPADRGVRASAGLRPGTRAGREAHGRAAYRRRGSLDHLAGDVPGRPSMPPR